MSGSRMRDAHSYKYQSDDVEPLREIPDASTNIRLFGWVVTRRDEPELPRLLFRPEESGEEGAERGRDEDGEHAIAPAPAGPLEDLSYDVGADEGVDDERGGDEAREETSPLESGDVGDKYG